MTGLQDRPIFVNREENDFGLAAALLEFFRDLDSAESRHGDIQYDQVRLQSNCRFQSGSSIRGHTHDIERFLEQRSDFDQEGSKIIGQNNPRSSHKRPSTGLASVFKRCIQLETQTNST